MKKIQSIFAPLAALVVIMLFAVTQVNANIASVSSKAKVTALVDDTSPQIELNFVQPNSSLGNLDANAYVPFNQKLNTNNTAVIQPVGIYQKVGVVQTDKGLILVRDTEQSVLDDDSKVNVVQSDSPDAQIGVAVVQTAVIQSDTQPQFGNATLNLNSSGKEKAEVNNDSGTRIVSTYIDTATLSVNTNMKATSAEKDSGQYSNLNEVVGQSQKAIVQLK